MKDIFYRYIQQLQDTITNALEEVDGHAKFKEDLWDRPEGGGGRTRVIENGAVFEKGGVNISAVHGALPSNMQAYFGVSDADFFACGLSLVLHPKNPFVPTVHANWRYFEMYDKKGTMGRTLLPTTFLKKTLRIFTQPVRKHVINITQVSTQSIKNVVMNTFGIPIEMRREVLGVFFLIIVKQTTLWTCKLGTILLPKLETVFYRDMSR